MSGIKKGLLSETQEKEFNSKKLKKIELGKKLKRKKDDQRRSQKSRYDKKKKVLSHFRRKSRNKKNFKGSRSTW